MFPTLKKKKSFFPYPKHLFRSLGSIPENIVLENQNQTPTSLHLSEPNISNFEMTTQANVFPSGSTQAPNISPSGPIQIPNVHPSNPIAKATITDILDTLRIPDAIKDLPKFDGNPRLLYEFLSNVEEILSHIKILDGSSHAQILLRAIRNKIEGEANEVLNMYGTILNWDSIKTNLILHYSDKRTETSLIKDLHSSRQGNKSLESYYSEIIEIQSSLYNNILIHESDANVIQAKKELFAEMCLNNFLTGLREPLGSSIRAMRPDTLAIAFSYCIKEQNIFYMKNEPTQSNFKKTFRSPQILGSSQSQFLNRTFNSFPKRAIPQQNTFYKPRINPNIFNYPNNNVPRYNFNYNNNNVPRNNFNYNNNNLPPNNFSYNSNNQPTLLNNPFNKNINNPFNTRLINQFSRNSNPPNIQQNPPPEPMDTLSAVSQLRQPTMQNSNVSNRTRSSRYPRYTIEEVHNLNADSTNNQQMLYDTEQSDFDELDQNLLDTFKELDTLNFPQSASHNLQDT